MTLRRNAIIRLRWVRGVVLHFSLPARLWATLSLFGSLVDRLVEFKCIGILTPALLFELCKGHAAAGRLAMLAGATLEARRSTRRPEPGRG